MSRNSGSGTAVVAGASGVAGYSLVEHLVREDWRVVALARRPPRMQGVQPISVDLTDAADARAKLSGLREATHIFYAVRYTHTANVLEPVEENLGMLRNTVEPIEAAADGLRHVHLIHGTKQYASHLGPFKTPAREDDPRSLVPNFYYAQEDWIAEHQRGKPWSWSIVRPHGLCHGVPDTPRNLVLVFAVYALVCRELGLPLSFPGTAENYRSVYQCTSVDLLSEAIAWMAEEPRCANQAYNITNGDYIRWENIWPRFADYFGMEVGPVRTVRLADVMPDKAPVWDAITARYRIERTPYDRMALWSYGDFVLQPYWDIMSDTLKARMHGFARAVRTEDEFIRYFDAFRDRGILPPR